MAGEVQLPVFFMYAFEWTEVVLADKEAIDLDEKCVDLTFNPLSIGYTELDGEASEKAGLLSKSFVLRLLKPTIAHADFAKKGFVMDLLTEMEASFSS